LAQRHGGGQSERQAAGVEAGAVFVEHRLMALSPVVERGTAGEQHAHAAFNAANAAAKVAIPGRIGGQSHGHEVFYLDDSVGKQESRHKNICGRPVKLFVSHPVFNGTNLEAAALLIVQNRPEDARRVEMRIGKPIDRAVHAYQSDRAHVADNSVVFDGLIGHRRVLPKWCAGERVSIVPNSGCP
jgi:hypothetical protein